MMVQLNGFQRVQAALHQVQKLRNFSGSQEAYWKQYLLALMEIAAARAGVIAFKSKIEASGWRVVAALPEEPANQAMLQALAKRIPALGQQCVPKGYAMMAAEEGPVLALNVLIDADPHACVAALQIGKDDAPQAHRLIEALIALNDLPGQFRLQQSAFESLQHQNRLADILDLMTLVNGQGRFVAGCMTVCNELANRFGCERVSLGWAKDGYVKIAAMSHTDHFERKMGTVQLLEQAMEEALDQECEIVLPASGAKGPVARDCEAYAQAAGAAALAVLPVRAGGEIAAAVLLERSSTPFPEAELRHLRIMLDQTSPRLADLRRRDRWWGARFAGWARERLAKLLGHKHTWAKLLGVSVAVLLLAAALVPIRYRVDSPMILRTDDITYVTAPFDGYLDSVAVRAGDRVKAGQLLLALDTRDLRLEQAGLLAEKNREEREMEKARAGGDLAEMLIAQARYDQTAAKLDINRFKIGQAEITAAYDGVVTEGDLAQKIGSPVKLGETLFKVGRIGNLYAEAQVSENEIRNVRPDAAGRIALASRPQDTYPVRVDVIEPTAIPSQKDNAFNVRCRIEGPVPDWFRPGMTGVSKLNAGRKPFLWIVCHRTVDFLWLKLWW